MRKQMFNWQGQSWVYLGLEGKPGLPVELQAKELFTRAGAELETLGFSLEQNVVRSRVFGRTRADRDAISGVRTKSFTGSARAATSSFIAPKHFESAADVALDVFAMSPPKGGGPRKVSEHTPPQSFIRFLSWGPMVFLAGMTCETEKTLEAQYRDILPRAHTLLTENSCDWWNVVGVSFFLHESQDPDALLSGVGQFVPIALDHAEVEFVEGFSRPNKLVEIEITARTS
jgi:enamine deaminase RidA (YjgF/YER057c/UK114 family)